MIKFLNLGIRRNYFSDYLSTDLNNDTYMSIDCFVSVSWNKFNIDIELKRVEKKKSNIDLKTICKRRIEQSNQKNIYFLYYDKNLINEIRAEIKILAIELN